MLAIVRLHRCVCRLKQRHMDSSMRVAAQVFHGGNVRNINEEAARSRNIMKPALDHGQFDEGS